MEHVADKEFNNDALIKMIKNQLYMHKYKLKTPIFITIT